LRDARRANDVADGSAAISLFEHNVKSFDKYLLAK